MTSREFKRGLAGAVVFALALLLLFFSLRARAEAQTYQPYWNPKIQLFNGGVPCAGCKLYTYLAGTTTTQATYSDTSGTSNANPVILDANGMAVVYLGASAYKFVLQTSAGVAIWTQDNIQLAVTAAPFALSNAGSFATGQSTEYFSTNINALNFANEYAVQHSGGFMTEAISGGINVPSSSTVLQADAVSGFAVNSSTATNAVGVTGQCRSAALNAHCWGMNSLVADTAGFANNQIISNEVDYNVHNTTTGGQAILIAGAWTALPASGNNYALYVSKPVGSSSYFWGEGLYFASGATAAPTAQGAAVYFQPVGTGLNQASQGMEFVSNDPTSGTHATSVNLSAAGSLIFACAGATEHCLALSGDATSNNNDLELVNTHAGGHTWDIGEMQTAGELSLRDINVASGPYWSLLFGGTGNFGGRFTHANTATRTYTLPDQTITFTGVAGQTSQKTESAADTNVLTFTPPAVAGSYRIRFVMSVSAANAATLGWTATWKDSNAAAQTPTNLSLIQSGTAAPALTFVTSAAGNYYADAQIDVDNSATAIIVKLTFTGTSFTAKVSATVERIL